MYLITSFHKTKTKQKKKKYKRNKVQALYFIIINILVFRVDRLVMDSCLFLFFFFTMPFIRENNSEGKKKSVSH